MDCVTTFTFSTHTGTLSYFEDPQRFESVFKMTRKTFDYICSLVKVPSLEDMNSYTFVDGRVLCLEDRVAVALIRLYSSEPSESLGSSVGVSESTVLLVTERFVDATSDLADSHFCWSDYSEMDKIKSMFEKTHNMHNCCGVICTTHIPFGQNCEHEMCECIRMQVVVDLKMRFMDFELDWAKSTNQLRALHGSGLFRKCEKGAWLNGNKLQVALNGSGVMEYIIGDAGYPLLPWLLTPYQEEDLSDSKAEFNRRHSASTSSAMKAMARFKDTWKYLQGETRCPANPDTLWATICACCRLHNIVIDMENDSAMPREKRNYRKEMRQLESEDAVRARDMLSQHFLASMSSESGVEPSDANEEYEVAASGSGDEEKKQDVRAMTEEIIN